MILFWLKESLCSQTLVDIIDIYSNTLHLSIINKESFQVLVWKLHIFPRWCWCDMYLLSRGIFLCVVVLTQQFCGVQSVVSYQTYIQGQKHILRGVWFKLENIFEKVKLTATDGWWCDRFVEQLVFDCVRNKIKLD